MPPGPWVSLNIIYFYFFRGIVWAVVLIMLNFYSVFGFSFSLFLRLVLQKLALVTVTFEFPVPQLRSIKRRQKHEGLLG